MGQYNELKYFMNHDILGGSGESGIIIDAQYWNETPFGTNSQNTFLLTGKV